MRADGRQMLSWKRNFSRLSWEEISKMTGGSLQGVGRGRGRGGMPVPRFMTAVSVGPFWEKDPYFTFSNTGEYPMFNERETGSELP